MDTDPKLNIVDESGTIIGEETRAQIHARGLLHREIHVWFFTSNGEVIFQHRSQNKDTYPGLLDATVGGHVEIGSDYLTTAVREMQEETGISTTGDELRYLQLVRSSTEDASTGKCNNALRAIYAYRYDGALHDLRVEEGEGVAFEKWPLDQLSNLSNQDRVRFVPSVLTDGSLALIQSLQKQDTIVSQDQAV